MKKAVFNVSALSAVLLPAVAFAQNFNYINSFVGQGLVYLRLAVTVLTILMTVFFLYNVLRFIMNTDASKVADLRKAMINGLIGLFVSVAVWGIIHLAGTITGVDTMSGSPAVTCPPGLTYNPTAGTCGTTTGFLQ
ncbi:MAG: hypothetical protein ABIO57_03245 [Candidatus Paceibacterota bacterium]